MNDWISSNNCFFYFIDTTNFSAFWLASIPSPKTCYVGGWQTGKSHKASLCLLPHNQTVTYNQGTLWAYSRSKYPTLYPACTVPLSSNLTAIIYFSFHHANIQGGRSLQPFVNRKVNCAVYETNQISSIPLHKQAISPVIRAVCRPFIYMLVYFAYCPHATNAGPA